MTGVQTCALPICFDLTTYVSASANGVTAMGPADGVLKLIELLVVSLGDVLGDAERGGGTSESLSTEGDVVVLGERIGDSLRGCLEEDEESLDMGTLSEKDSRCRHWYSPSVCCRA